MYFVTLYHCKRFTHSVMLYFTVDGNYSLKQIFYCIADAKQAAATWSKFTPAPWEQSRSQAVIINWIKKTWWDVFKQKME